MASKEMSIHELKLVNRTDDTEIYKHHRLTVNRLRALCENQEEGIHIAAKRSFETAEGTTESVLTALGVITQQAVLSGNVYDLGVVENDVVIEWAGKAAEQPIISLPWTAPAVVFLATHPGEVPFRGTVSVYVVWKHDEQHVQISEMLFIEESEQFVAFISMVAAMPLGSTRAVRVIAWSETPTAEDVASALEPTFMAVAFLAAHPVGNVS